MPVPRADAELAHAPRLVADRLDDLSSARRDLGIERIDGRDLYICVVRVVAQLAGRDRVGTLAREDDAGVALEEAEARITDLAHRKAEDVPVESGRAREVGHGDDVPRTCEHDGPPSVFQRSASRF